MVARARTSFPIWLLVIVLGASSLLIAATVFTYRSTTNHMRAARHSVELRLAAQSLLQATIDAETGQRGYLLTMRPEFLEPYERGRLVVDERLRILTTMLRDAGIGTPEQLPALVRERMELLDTAVRLAREGNRAAANEIVVGGHGKDVQDRIRSVLAVLDDRVSHEMEVQRAAATRQDRITTWVVGLSALSIVGALALGWIVRREAVRRSQRDAERTALLAQLETTVAQRTQRLTEVNEELEAFSYSVSHDLRAPLRAIAGYGRILEEEHATTLDDEGRDILARTRAAASRMGHLIDDMLAYSRITRAEIRTEHVDLSRLATQIISELRATAPERAVEVTIAPHLTVTGDDRLLRTALENLLANAWKFTSKTAAPRIELATESRDGELVYLVRDNGAGFDMKYAHRLFAPFQRLHAQGAFEGTGIGLATVKRVITKHGGRVWIDRAAKDEGVTVAFTLRGPT